MQPPTCFGSTPVQDVSIEGHGYIICCWPDHAGQRMAKALSGLAAVYRGDAASPLLGSPLMHRNLWPQQLLQYKPGQAGRATQQLLSAEQAQQEVRARRPSECSLK